MTVSAMPEDALDARFDRLRQDLREDIQASAAALRQDFRQDIQASAAETRRHFEVVAESLRSEIRVGRALPRRGPPRVRQG